MIVKITSLLALFSAIVSAKVICNELKIETEPKYLDIKYEVSHAPEKILFTFDSELHIDLDNNAYISFLIKSKLDGDFMPLLRLEPVPFCKYLGVEKKPAFLSFALMMMKSLAEVPEDCPIKKGRYMLKEFAVDENILVPMMSSGDFEIEILLYVKEGDNLKQIMKSVSNITLDQPE